MEKLLSTLLQGLTYNLRGPADPLITDIVFDSRKVTPGALFVAFQGVHHNGNDFAQAAVTAGARAVLSEASLDLGPVTVVRVPDALQALSHVSAQLWENPSRQLLTVGITGTNGKTTISYLLESIFRAAGWKVGVLGTISYRFNGHSRPAANTTPFASDLQRFLSEVSHGGGRACVLEVSSHALALGRVAGIEFDVGVFTNLTQDHLDFHQTFEAYAAAKAKLFQSLTPRPHKSFPCVAILNRDDAWSDKMAAECTVPIMGYRLHAPADVYSKRLVCDANGSRFELHGPGGSCAVQLSLIGEFNVMNALAAAAVAFSQGISVDVIRQGLEGLQGVPGRMERIDGGQPFTVVVDYAHTEDALRHVLNALRELRPARLLTVFGCGGDRDRAKRPLMGETAAQLSDHVYVTTDNPRSEEPSRIALDIEVGLRRIGAKNYEIVLDREAAIERALAGAQPNDIVLIAGKGHEHYQIMKDRTLPFDDSAVARRFLPAASTRP